VKVVWSPLALERVVEIGEGIARDSPNAAADFVTGIFAAAKRLARFPQSGRTIPEAQRPELREIRFHQHRVFYRTKLRVVEIVAVRHTREHIEADDPDLS
jgi:plasmid stabilization system protein ParE